MSPKRPKFNKKKWNRDNYIKKKLARLSPKSKAKFKRKLETPAERETRLAKQRKRTALNTKKKAQQQPATMENQPSATSAVNLERDRRVQGEQILSLHRAVQEGAERALDNTQLRLTESLNGHRDWIDDQRVVTQNLLNRNWGHANMTDEEVETYLANRNRTRANQASPSVSSPQRRTQLFAPTQPFAGVPTQQTSNGISTPTPPTQRQPCQFGESNSNLITPMPSAAATQGLDGGGFSLGSAGPSTKRPSTKRRAMMSPEERHEERCQRLRYTGNK